MQRICRTGLLVAAVVFLFGLAPVLAQTPNGDGAITGRAKDPQGADLPGAYVVASVSSRQGFLTSGSDAFASRPSQPPDEISDHSFGSYALPVHSGGNRLGVSPNFPCHPLWAPANVQFNVELK